MFGIELTVILTGGPADEALTYSGAKHSTEAVRRYQVVELKGPGL